VESAKNDEGNTEINIIIIIIIIIIAVIYCGANCIILLTSMLVGICIRPYESVVMLINNTLLTRLHLHLAAASALCSDARQRDTHSSITKRFSVNRSTAIACVMQPFPLPVARLCFLPTFRRVWRERWGIWIWRVNWRCTSLKSSQGFSWTQQQLERSAPDNESNKYIYLALFCAWKLVVHRQWRCRIFWQWVHGAECMHSIARNLCPR